MCIYIYLYIHIYIYDIRVVLRFLDWRYKVSLTWDSNSRPSDFRSDALPTELASLTQGWSSTCLHEKWHQSTQTCAWLLADGQAQAPPEVTLYLSSTSTLAQCYLNFGILLSPVASLTIFFVVNQDVMRNYI